MLSKLFQGIFAASGTPVVSIGNFLLCIGISLLCGLVLALASAYRSRPSKSFLVCLSLLPATVCVVIMLVNGNVGTAVAVAGAFSLIRFRSAPGTAKEIAALFLAMGAGLIAGMGYLGYAVLFSLTLAAAVIALERFDFGLTRKNALRRTLRVTMPEDLNYADALSPVLALYTREATLAQVKTTAMGSLYRLTYQITLKDGTDEKALIDALRCRNGNLEVMLATPEGGGSEL